jgi:asparagine synthetase B (glutamine-hydrolysing)
MENLFNGTKRLDGLRGCKDNETNIQDIIALEAAVHRQLMCDVPYGVFLEA